MKWMKFNPGFLSDEQLVASFCVRKHEFESIVEMLREDDSASSRHRLVIGPRGSGKTTLLLRVAIEIKNNEQLSTSFFPVVFSEESYGVTNAADFWFEAVSRIADQAPSRQVQIELRQTLDELRQLLDIGMLERRCLATLLEFADRQDKRLVLLVENLDMMFKEIADEEAGWHLRQTLQTEPRVLLIASANSRFDEIDNPDQAFYDLFATRQLRALDQEECAVLWESVSGQKRPPEVMRGLEILTGGNPRLLSIIARFGAEMSFRDLMADLLALIDDLTDYFKSHIEAIPPQERQVYLGLAELWEPATTREISDRVRLDTSKCSAFLKRLIGRGIVDSVQSSENRRLYRLTQRLFNIYYLLRRSRAPHPLVQALVRFMDAYYSPDELQDLAVRMLSEARGLEPELLPLHRDALEDAVIECSEAIGRIESDPSGHHEFELAKLKAIKGACLASLGREEEANDTLRFVIERFRDKSDQEFQTPVVAASLQLAENERGRGNYQEALALMELALGRLDDQDEATKCHCHLVCAHAHLGAGNVYLAEQDIRSALSLESIRTSILGIAVTVLIDFAVVKGVEQALELVEQSASRELLFPLAVAFKKELGEEVRVPEEIEQVANDIQKRINTHIRGEFAG